MNFCRAFQTSLFMQQVIRRILDYQNSLLWQVMVME